MIKYILVSFLVLSYAGFAQNRVIPQDPASSTVNPTASVPQPQQQVQQQQTVRQQQQQQQTVQQLQLQQMQQRVQGDPWMSSLPREAPSSYYQPSFVLTLPGTQAPATSQQQVPMHDCPAGMIRSTNATTSGDCIPISDNFGSDTSTTAR